MLKLYFFDSNSALDDTMFVTFQTVPEVILHQLWISLQLSRTFQHLLVCSFGFTASNVPFGFGLRAFISSDNLTVYYLAMVDTRQLTSCRTKQYI